MAQFVPYKVAVAVEDHPSLVYADDAVEHIVAGGQQAEGDAAGGGVIGCDKFDAIPAVAYGREHTVSPGGNLDRLAGCYKFTDILEKICIGDAAPGYFCFHLSFVFGDGRKAQQGGIGIGQTFERVARNGSSCCRESFVQSVSHLPDAPQTGRRCI